MKICRLCIFVVKENAGMTSVQRGRPPW